MACLADNTSRQLILNLLSWPAAYWHCAAPAPEPKLEVLEVDELPKAQCWNDCPNCDTEVKDKVIVRDRRSGDTVEAYRCKYGHYFKGYHS